MMKYRKNSEELNNIFKNLEEFSSRISSLSKEDIEEIQVALQEADKIKECAEHIKSKYCIKKAISMTG